MHFSDLRQEGSFSGMICRLFELVGEIGQYQAIQEAIVVVGEIH